MEDPRTVDHAMRWMRERMIIPQSGMVPEDDRERRAREMALAFQASPGALRTILEMSVFRPGVNHQLGPGAYEHYAQLRQGQDQLAAAILEYLDLAEQLNRRSRDDHALDVQRTEDLQGSGGPGGSSPGWGDPAFRV